MQKWINDYGLINAKESDVNAENAPLWTLEFIFLTQEGNFQAFLQNYIYLCKTEVSGIYHQFPFKVEGKDSYMSPDQLIAFIGSLSIAKRTDTIKEIWSYLLKHLFTYDNKKPNTININRIMQLSVILFCGVHAGVTWLKPLLSLVLIYSCITKRKETSGKLKAWVMFKSLNMTLTEKICTFFIKKNSYLKSWYGVFKEYFQEEGHPITKAAEKYK